MPVGVIGEPDRPVLGHHDGGRVEQNHLNRSRQFQRDGLLPCDRRQDAFPRPLGLVLQDPFSQRHRILDAHAAVTEVAAAAREERLRRRAMQVDTFLVREDELDQAERVPRSGTLAQTQRALGEPPEVFRRGIDDRRGVSPFRGRFPCSGAGGSSGRVPGPEGSLSARWTAARSSTAGRSPSPFPRRRPASAC